MLLSTSIGDLQGIYGNEKAIEMFAKSGFDALDYSFCNDKIGKSEGQDDYFKGLREYTENLGVHFHQSHAPFASSVHDDDEFNKRRFEEIVRSLRYSSILGIKSVVVHPCQHLPYMSKGAAETLFECNMEFYSRLIPYCEEYGVRIALENMWQTIPGSSKIMPSTCGHPSEFIRYFDTLNNDCFTCCLDIGHAALCGEDPAAFIRALGKNRLGALHVHDVDGIRDSHTLPYLGVIDWDSVMCALADIGYSGYLNYETVSMLNGKPAELYDAYNTLAVKTGRYLISKFEEYSAK